MKSVRGDQVSFFVLPVEGRLVRDPKTGIAVPEKGRVVPNTQYWRRRLRAGELRIVESLDTESEEIDLIVEGEEELS